MTDTPDLSWDVQSETAPDRPKLESSLPESTPLTRPKRTIAVLVLAILVLMVWIALALLTWLRFEEVQAALIAALPDDLSSDYSDKDIQSATLVLLIGAGALGVALSLILVASARTLMKNRSGAARVVLTVSAVLSVGATILAALISNAKTTELVLHIAHIGLIISTGVIAFTPAVSRWLKQQLRRESVPLTQLRGHETL